MSAKAILAVVLGIAVLGAAAYLGTQNSARSGSDSITEGEPLVDVAETTTEITHETTAPEDDFDFSVFDEPQETDGEKHIIPLDEIRSGGVGKDGIPPIDDPKFTTVEEASTYLSDGDLGIALSINGVDRFYPFSILVWHEIVNDQIDGDRFLVTYCPLCFSSAVFEPLVEGEEVEFGVSGKLWNSNLIMYDRKNDNYWSQVLGTAIVGPQAGQVLDLLPSDQLSFGVWKEQFPAGEVLSQETGASRHYGRDPYGDYYTDNSDVFFPVNNEDDRLERKEYILGVIVDDVAKAYLPASVKDRGTVIDEVAGRTLELVWEEKLEVVRIYDVTDGGRERVNPFGHFWFSWVAAHPDTLLYK